MVDDEIFNRNILLLILKRYIRFIIILINNNINLKKMKKILVVFAAIVAISFASCGNSTKSAASVNDSDTVVVDTAADSVTVDSAVVAK